MTRHQLGISAVVQQMSFHEEARDGITKCQLFSHAKGKITDIILLISHLTC